MKRNIFKIFANLFFMLFIVNSMWSQNTPPTFTSTPITSINDNQSYTYTITSKDVDGDAVTLTAPTLPSWLFLTPTNIATLAGSTTQGFVDGSHTAAKFRSPISVAVDASGTVYVADSGNNSIRKITPAGVVSTLAGSGVSGFVDDTGTAARFANPNGVAVDASGTVYVADSGGNRIRKITPVGVVSTLAGSGVAGYVDDTGTAAQFNYPTGVSVDASGTVYVADQNNQRIRKITSLGVVTTLAGSGVAGYVDDTGTAAQLNYPTGVAVDASGNVYVADQSNNRIRKITSTGVVSTLAGSGTSGFADGTGTAAQFNTPYGVAVDALGNIFVADQYNNRIRKITSTGVVSTLAGSGTHGFADGSGIDAQFYFPLGVAVDTSENVYVADATNNLIRKIIIDHISGDPTGQVGTHNVVLNANDGQGGSTNQSFTITINDVTAPTLSTLAPSNNATDIATNTNLILIFSENIQKGTGNILIKDALDNSTVQTIDVTSNVVTISGATVAVNPPSDLLGHKNYYIQIPATAFTDMASNAYAGIADMITWNFTTANTSPTFTSTPITSIDENQTYTYSISTADADGDTVGLTAPTLPSWLSLTTDIIVNTLAGSGVAGFADGTATAAQFSTPRGVAVDALGNVYVADKANNRIRKITPAGVVSTLAGSGVAGYVDDTGTAAQFNLPSGVAVDASGNVYVADQNNQCIRKITSAGVVSTLAGSGVAGYVDDTGTAAQFWTPSGVAVDNSGNVYVADATNSRIRKITPTGVVTTLSGSQYGFADGIGTAARFSSPRGVAVDASGNVYVADYDNNRIRKITAAGVVTTLAGSGRYDFADGIGTAAQFYQPTGVAVDASGNIYVADRGNNRIRKITPTGVVTTLAGLGTQGFVDGTGTSARFYNPLGVAVDTSGNVYVADTGNERIRKVNISNISGDPTGHVGTHNVVLNANDGNGGSTNQSFTITVNDATAPMLSTLSPTDNATDVVTNTNLVLTFNENVQKGTGNILIKDASDNSTVQTIDVTTSVVSISGAVVTINPPTNLSRGKNYYIQIPATAFTDMSSNAYAGIADMTSWNFTTRLNKVPVFTSTPITSIDDNQTYTYAITTNDGNGDAITLTAPTLPSWLSLTTDIIVNTLAGSGTQGFADGIGTAAQFSRPYGVAVDASGTVYVADYKNQLIRKITSAGVVSTLAGSGTAGFADGTDTSAQFNTPTGIAVDASGTVYVADSGNNRIRKITSAGVVSTLAGSGVASYVDDTGTAAQFNTPTGITVDASGTVYVADSGNNRIRKITSAGVVSTLAGSGVAGYVDDTGTAAQFNYPAGVAVDASGVVYVADFYNNRIRKITSTGVVTTFAGSGTIGFTDGTGTAAQFYFPIGVAVDASENVFIADINNNRIRKITAAGMVSTLAGSGTQGFADGTGTAAQFYFPTGVAVDASGNVFVADRFNNRIRKIVQNKILTGDPTGQMGTHNVVLNANDGNGGSTNQSFTITVNALASPTISTLSPTDNATDVVTNTNLVLTFNENIQKGTGNILIKDALDNSTVQSIDVTTSAVTVSNTQVIINPPSDLLGHKNYYIQIPTTAFTDTASNAYAGIADMTTWNFTTANTAPIFTSTPITSIDENQTYSYSVTTTDADGDAVALTTPTLPSWLSLTINTTVSTLAGSGTAGFVDASGTTAQFDQPYGVAVDASGTVYVADYKNQLIRKITSAGVVSTLAGSGTAGFADGIGMAAQFNGPSGVAVDASGTVYVADSGNHRIRKITAAGVVTTLAGSGTAGFADGIGTVAQFNTPSGIAVDASGTVYVAGSFTNRIRKITAAGVVSTLAGSGVAGFADGTGTSAQFWAPSGVAVDASGIVYVTDYVNNRIRKITASGVVTTLAGSGTSGYVNDTGILARFRSPSSVSVDASGNIYVADYGNRLIRKITSSGAVSTLAGSGTQGFADGMSSTAQFNTVTGVAVTASGTVYVVDRDNYRIRKISTSKDLSGDTTGHAGIHNVVIHANDGNGGTVDQSFTVTVNAVLGIEDNIIKGFALYPNPVKGILNIRAQETLKTIQVFDIMGQQVFLKHLNSNKTTINLNRLPQGSYFVKIITDKTSKLVKLIKR